MKKAILILLSLAMLFSLAACGKAEPSKTPDTGKTDTSAPADTGKKDDGKKADDGKKDDAAPAAAAPESLSVAMAYDYGSLDTIAMTQYGFDPIVCVMEPLWDYGLDGEVKLVLAESYEWVSDDHMVVKLKPGIKFSNGNPLTASDVIFTMHLMAEAGGAYAPQRVQTTDLERSKALDDLTVDWYLKTPSVLHMSVEQQMFIYDEESYDAAKQAQAPIGTGPYVVTEYVVNSHTIVERRDDYWGELPPLKTITFRVLKESSQQINALETGLVDCSPVALSDVDYVKSLKGVQLRPRGGNWIYLGFNISQDGKLADPIAREAICHAIDVEAISNLVYYGLAKPMKNPFTSAYPDHTEKMDGLGVYEKGYDLELAKKQAEESGLVGKTITLANNGQSQFVTISEMIQNMLAKIGVTVEIASYDTATYSDVKNDKTLFDICVSNGVAGNMCYGDQFVNAITRNKIYGIKENFAYGHGDRYWEIKDKALSEIDNAKRAAINEELMGYYVETNPTFGLLEFDSYNAFPDNIDLSNYWDRIIANYFCTDFIFN